VIRTQLTGVDYENDWQSDEGFEFDAAGNMTGGDFSVDADGYNRMGEGAGFVYLYDNEGNRTLRFDDDGDGQLDADDTDITEYGWDHRNRLVSVTYYETYADYSATDPDVVIEYAYDHANRWIRKQSDDDADGTVDGSTVFVYDGDQIVLQFDSDDASDAAAADLSHRYLWGPGRDQLLVDEHVTSLSTAGANLWTLADHLGSIRDGVDDSSAVQLHRAYTSFGQIASSSVTVDTLFAYTARPLELNTTIALAIQNNQNRWYEPVTAGWLTQDPSGHADDVNLYRYVGNGPMGAVDPSGLCLVGPWSPSWGLSAPPLPQQAWDWGQEDAEKNAEQRRKQKDILRRRRNLDCYMSEIDSPRIRRLKELANGPDVGLAKLARQALNREVAVRMNSRVHPDHDTFIRQEAQAENNAQVYNPMVWVLAPHRKVTALFGTTPEQVSTVLAVIGGDTHVPADYFVEVAPGIFRRPMVFAPEEHPNRWKYSLATEVIADPTTYIGVGVVGKGLRAPQYARYIKLGAAVNYGDDALDGLKYGRYLDHALGEAAYSGTGQATRTLANPHAGTFFRGLRARAKLGSRFDGLYKAAQKNVKAGRQSQVAALKKETGYDYPVRYEHKEGSSVRNWMTGEIEIRQHAFYEPGGVKSVFMHEYAEQYRKGWWTEYMVDLKAVELAEEIYGHSDDIILPFVK